VETEIKGSLGLTLLPHPALTIGELRLHRGDRDLATVGELRIGVALWPLLGRTALVDDIELVKPVMDSGQGLLALAGAGARGETPAAEGPGGFKIGVADRVDLRIHDGNLTYRDPGYPTPFQATNARLSLSVSLAGAKPGGVGFAPSGSIAAGTLTTPWGELQDLRGHLRSGAGKMRLEGFKADAFGGRTRGYLVMDRTDTVPTFDLKLEIADLETNRVLTTFAKPDVASGQAQVSSELHWNGTGASAWSTLDGNLLLEGSDITLYKLDIDNLLKKYKDTQRVNLVDLGAYFLLGPLGSAVVKGGKLAAVAGASDGGTSRIINLLSKWTIKNGVASAEDVAFTTERNRLALKGSIDLAAQRYEEVTVAALDKKGCAIVTQRMHGPISDPTTEKPNLLNVLTGPVTKTLNAPIKLITGDQCKPFYEGAVVHPESTKPD
jgi:AsmA protein